MASGAAMTISRDPQFLIDGLIRSMHFGNEQRIQEFGEQLASAWSGAQGVGEDGVLRRFHELEDVDFVVEQLDASPARAAELKNGKDLTEQEFARLADKVDERCFDDDGDHDLWNVARIESADGKCAYVGHILNDDGCHFVGVFPSLEEAKEALKPYGYVDGADFRRRYPFRTPPSP
jgi:hypothetical protein